MKSDVGEGELAALIAERLSSLSSLSNTALTAREVGRRGGSSGFADIGVGCSDWPFGVVVGGGALVFVRLRPRPYLSQIGKGLVTVGVLGGVGVTLPGVGVSVGAWLLGVGNRGGELALERLRHLPNLCHIGSDLAFLGLEVVGVGEVVVGESVVEVVGDGVVGSGEVVDEVIEVGVGGVSGALLQARHRPSCHIGRGLVAGVVGEEWEVVVGGWVAAVVEEGVVGCWVEEVEVSEVVGGRVLAATGTGEPVK